MLIIFSCSTPKVITDYDSKTDFTKYKTYAFYEDVGNGLNELDVKRIKEAMEAELKTMSLKKNKNPDFYINFTSKYTESNNNNTIAIGFGNAGRNGGYGVSGGIPIGGEKLNEELIIEFVDANTNLLFWKGVLNSTIKEQRKPEEKEAHFNMIIPKILLKYPPK